MGTPSETQRVPRRLLGLTAVFLLLAWAANAAVLAFDEFGYEYTDSINFGRLLGEMVSLNPIDVIEGFLDAPFFGVLNLAMLASLVAIVFVETTRLGHRTVVLLTITGLSLPVAALGLFEMLSWVSTGLDGEWLGEAWPILESFFFWSVALCIYSLRTLRESRRSTTVNDGERLLQAVGQAEGSQS